MTTEEQLSNQPSLSIVDKENEKEKETIPYNNTFPISIGSDQNASSHSPFDLNKIFQVNFSYNFDLLKTLLEGLLKSQKSNEDEIFMLKYENQELKKNLIDLNILVCKNSGDEETVKKLMEKKKQLENENFLEKQKIMNLNMNKNINEKNFDEGNIHNKRHSILSVASKNGEEEGKTKPRKSVVKEVRGAVKSPTRYKRVRAPANDIKLEPNINNEELTNKIIVSKIFFIEYY